MYCTLLLRKLEGQSEKFSTLLPEGKGYKKFVAYKATGSYRQGNILPTILLSNAPVGLRVASFRSGGDQEKENEVVRMGPEDSFENLVTKGTPNLLITREHYTILLSAYTAEIQNPISKHGELSN